MIGSCFEIDAPVRLKKELDTVLALQADVDVIEKTIQTTTSIMKKESLSDVTLAALSSLERTHSRLIAKVDTLYASLNVQTKFPELEGIDLDFVRTLLLARDLKINIRKRAIGSFFEWDKLDWAVGGAQKALGNSSTFFECPSNLGQGQNSISKHERQLLNDSLRS